MKAYIETDMDTVFFEKTRDLRKEFSHFRQDVINGGGGTDLINGGGGTNPFEDKCWLCSKAGNY